MSERPEQAPESPGVAVETEDPKAAPASPREAAPQRVKLGLQVDAPNPTVLDATRGSARRHTLGLGVEVRKPDPSEFDARPESARAGAFGRALPAEYLTDPRERLVPRDRVVLERLEQLAWFMDELLPIPGTRVRVGLDPIIGLFPFAGDVVTCAIAIYFLVEAIRFGARPRQLLRMTGNIMLDVGLGLIPLAGDVFDALFKANVRNLEIIRDEVLGFARVEEPPIDVRADRLEAPIRQEEPEAVEAAPETIEAAPETARDAPEEAEASVSEQVDADRRATPRESASTATTASPVKEHTAETVTGELVERSDEGAVVEVLSTPSTLLRRESTTSSKVVGYTLIAGLFLLFCLPWALLAYLIFSG